LWANTTATNKFIYFKNHLALFEGINATSVEITLADANKQDIADLLDVEEANLLD